MSKDVIQCNVKAGTQSLAQSDLNSALFKPTMANLERLCAGYKSLHQKRRRGKKPWQILTAGLGGLVTGSLAQGQGRLVQTWAELFARGLTPTQKFIRMATYGLAALTEVGRLLRLGDTACFCAPAFFLTV